MFGWKCLKIDWGIFVLSKNDGGQLVMVVLFYKKRKSRIKTFTHLSYYRVSSKKLQMISSIEMMTSCDYKEKLPYY